MINSRNPDDLSPVAKALCLKFLAKCKENHISVIVTSTYRDNESQNELYAQGRTKPGHIVTNAKGGQSAHNYRVAFDFCPLDVHGQADWNNTKLFQQLGKIGKECGLDWAGDWVSFKEMAHFQVPGFKIPK